MRYWIFIAISLASTQLQAAAPTAEKLKYCTEIGGIAKTVMTKRQDEVSMSLLMAANSSSSGMNDLGAAIIQDAYDQPAFRTPENKEIAIKQFENKWFAGCLKASP